LKLTLSKRALSTRGRRLLGAGGAAVLCLALLPIATDAAAGETAAKQQRVGGKEVVANYDSRNDGVARKVIANRSAQLAANPKPGVRQLRDQLGVQGLVDLDGLTGTARRVTKIDGFLTGPTRISPEKVARDYLNGHADVFGLSAGQVNGLTLVTPTRTSRAPPT